MRRREFITLLGGAAAWPLAARAQQGERMRRIGVLMSTAADDPEDSARIAAFPQGLRRIGLGRRPQRADRIPLGRRRSRPHSQIRGGVGRARAGRHSGHRHPGRGRVATGDAAPSRSCSCSRSTLSAPASSRAWRGRAATPPALSCSNTASAGNGWSCSRRSHPV